MSIFELIRKRKHKELASFVKNYNPLMVDGKGRSALFLCLIEQNYDALFILLKSPVAENQFNELMKGPKNMGGMYEFQQAFLSFKSPKELTYLFPFIKDLNKQDNSGFTALHCFLHALSTYSIQKHMHSHMNTMDSKNLDTIHQTLNEEVKYFFKKAKEAGMDFSIKNQNGKTAFEIMDVEYFHYFYPSIEWAISLEEKINLEHMLSQNNQIKSKQKI